MASRPIPALENTELSSPYCSDPNCPYCADLRKMEEAVRRGGPLPLPVQKNPKLPINR
jgi:hypothetical protein